MSDNKNRQRIETITVFCGSKSGELSEYVKMAKLTGRILAERSIQIIYGGGKVGMMGELADASLMENGRVTGIIPSFLCTKEIAHDGLTELVVVETMHERKLLMQEGCQGFITMPGGFGTMEEFFEVLTWGQLGLHQKPIGLLNAAGYFDPLIDFLDQMVTKGFLSEQDRKMVLSARTPEKLLDQMLNYSPPPVPKWLNLSTT